MSDHEKSPVLGRQVPVPTNPLEFKIDTVPASYYNGDVEIEGRTLSTKARYLVRLSCPEFTSLCPVTGQPDFAHIVIDYMPAALLIESKALKLFLSAFRNEATFHETCTNLIGHRLFAACKPHWMRVNAFWFPRGGIPIDVFWECGVRPERPILPPIDIPTYRAR